MTFEGVRDYALKLINQYSIAGDIINPEYNNQADYLEQIPILINDGLTYIATTARPIEESVSLSDLTYTSFGAFRRYTMPTNTWKITGRGLLQAYQGHLRRYNKIKRIGERQFLIADADASKGDFLVEYYRYPEMAIEGEELDGDPETHPLVAYYAAAHLVMYDDAFRYSALKNEFETRLSRLQELRHAEYSGKEDVYGAQLFSGWDDGTGGDVYAY